MLHFLLVDVFDDQDGRVARPLLASQQPGGNELFQVSLNRPFAYSPYRGNGANGGESIAFGRLALIFPIEAIDNLVSDLGAIRKAVIAVKQHVRSRNEMSLQAVAPAERVVLWHSCLPD